MLTTLTVVIPAHDEATVIERCLSSVERATTGQHPHVLVVCNGCRDDTAQRAKHAGAQVVELVDAGKHLALNAGDALANGWPRVYLDADTELSAGALDALVLALDTEEPRVAAPRLVIDQTGCSVLVRAFYRVFTRLPYLRQGLVGAGCYALNAAGRARFEEFPAITADDLFVQGLFASHERVVLVDASFTTRAPRNVKALLGVRIRSYAGASEAARMGLAGTMDKSSTGPLRALLREAVRRPSTVGDIAVYAVINGVARKRARSSAVRWHRDDSTR